MTTTLDLEKTILLLSLIVFTLNLVALIFASRVFVRARKLEKQRKERATQE